MCHYWFMLLEQAIMPHSPSHPLAVLLKLACDQLLMAPFGSGLFFFVMKCWEGHPDKALSHVKAVLPKTLAANYAVWPLANVVNFAFIPLDQRILYVNVIGVFWAAFISHMANSPPRGSQKPPPVPEKLQQAGQSWPKASVKASTLAVDARDDHPPDQERERCRHFQRVY